RADVQDTDLSPAESEPTGTGTCCELQPRPFHASAMATFALPRWYVPTASQKLLAGAHTPSRSGAPAGTVSTGGLGVCCRFQVVPFHLSARVTLIPDLSRLVPTAVHAPGDEQETDSSRPPGSVAFGDFTIFHAGLPARAPPALARTRQAVSAVAASTTPTRVPARWQLHRCIAFLRVQSPVSMSVAGIWPRSSVTPAAVQF